MVVNQENQINSHRQRWMALLARAPLEYLEARLEPYLQLPFIILKAPQTGLIMAQGRIGGTGDRFNLGEVSATKCVLQLEISSQSSQEIPKMGVAYVLGGNQRHAFLAAFADALLQEPDYFDELNHKLLQDLESLLGEQQQTRLNRTLSTKVDFFTVARQSSGPEMEGEE
jgi:alpha-D-ribose 1-methylphosphonate 5-triphosphate synthase subunit PhnG